MEYITSDMRIVVDAGFKALIPPLQEEEYAKLMESIRESGIEAPIVLWESDDPCQHGIIVDGMHRYAIGTELGIPIPYVFKQFVSVPQVKLWMIRNQLGRRNLTTAQKAELGVEAKHAYEDEAKERMLLGPGLDESVERGESRELAARDVGVGAETITRMERVHKAPEVHELVRAEVLSLATGSDIARLPKEQRVEVLRHVDVKGTTQDNTKVLKPLIDVIKAKQSAEAAHAKVLGKVSEERQALIDKFERYYDEVVARTPYRVSNLVGQELFYESEAKRKAGFMALPVGVMTTLLGELSRRADIERCLAFGMPVKTQGVTITVNQVDTLLLSGVPITETTNIAEEASKITTAKSVADMERKLESAAKREAGAISRAEEEAACEAIASRVRVNETMLGSLVRALRLMEEAVADGRVYCPIHGPECRFDMTKLAFECGMSIYDASEAAMANISLLAPKTEEVKAMVDVEIRTIGGGRTTDKQLKTKLVRVAGDIGKLYREQP